MTTTRVENRWAVGAAYLAAHLAATLALGSCQLERLFPEEVGYGAARLSVLSAALIIDIADADSACGFSSDAAREGVTIEGEEGELGVAVWKIDGCKIKLGSTKQRVAQACDGAETHASGELVVSGRRTVAGLLTGNPENPVIPQTPDAVKIELEVRATGFHVTRGASDPHLSIKHGTIEIDSTVHLAESASLGVCAVPTSEITIGALRVADALYRINDGDGREFDVDVPTAELFAQIGAWGDWENEVHGTIAVWDSDVPVFRGTRFDESYDRAKFRETFACKEDLKQPLAYTCPSIKPRLAEGAAQLTIQTVGNVVSAFSKDTHCGFESEAVKQAAVVEGDVGRPGGAVTYRIDSPCELDFGGGTVVGETCDGVQTVAYGKARFTGSLEVRGRLTGDANEPVIPGSPDAVTLEVHLELEGVRVQGAAPESLEVTHGNVSAVMRPRMAIDGATGACSIDTPAVAFDDVAWEPGSKMVIHADGNALGITVDSSHLRAVNGAVAHEENLLSGTITLGGESFDVPLDGRTTLDPAYDPQTFLASFACIPNLRMPSSAADCSMNQAIGDGVARLVMQTVGTLASAVNMDATCGFSNKMDVLKNPTRVTGDAGEMGELQWDIEGCSVGAAQPSAYATDCAGAETYWTGSAQIDSTRVVRGMREDVEVLFFAVADSIAPSEPLSIDLWLDAQLSEFATWALPADGGEPLGILTIHEGTLSAFVQPMTGWSAEQERFTVPTPVARLQSVRLQNARATLESDGMVFEITIDDTDLFAVNGVVDDRENAIEGVVTIDGADVQVGGALNPDYDAAALAASWACNVAPEIGACTQTPPALLGLWGLFALALRRQPPSGRRATRSR